MSSSILDNTFAARQRYHACGGTLLYSSTGGGPMHYCSRCGAFAYGEDAEVPSGTDPAANRAAFDAGDSESPPPTATTPRPVTREDDMILNLTQHPATPEQIAAGVVDPSTAGGRWNSVDADATSFVQRQLTFATLPDGETILARAGLLAEYAASTGAARAMIGGAPYLMAPLELALRNEGIEPVYAFSVRESAEQTLSDGSVRKVNTFRHAGFVPAS